MSLITPEKIRTLQRKLYCKAKAEPRLSGSVLMDKGHGVDSSVIRELGGFIEHEKDQHHAPSQYSVARCFEAGFLEVV